MCDQVEGELASLRGFCDRCATALMSINWDVAYKYYAHYRRSPCKWPQKPLWGNPQLAHRQRLGFPERPVPSYKVRAISVLMLKSLDVSVSQEDRSECYALRLAGRRACIELPTTLVSDSQSQRRSEGQSESGTSPGLIPRTRSEAAHLCQSTCCRWTCSMCWTAAARDPV